MPVELGVTRRRGERRKLAAVEVSSLMAANGASAILPEDEDYDVDAEARIIYKLHEKLKLAKERAKASGEELELERASSSSTPGSGCWKPETMHSTTSMTPPSIDTLKSGA